jgi:hypothetical protein
VPFAAALGWAGAAAPVGIVRGGGWGRGSGPRCCGGGVEKDTRKSPDWNESESSARRSARFDPASPPLSAPALLLAPPFLAATAAAAAAAAGPRCLFPHPSLLPSAREEGWSGWSARCRRHPLQRGRWGRAQRETAKGARVAAGGPRSRRGTRSRGL